MSFYRRSRPTVFHEFRVDCCPNHGCFGCMGCLISLFAPIVIVAVVVGAVVLFIL